MKVIIHISVILFSGLLSLSASAIDIITQKNIGLEAANDIAKMSIDACRAGGFNVSAVVVDKHGNVRSVMRDDLAAKYTIEIAKRKANMVIMSGIASGAFRTARTDIQQELNHIDGLIVMQGGLPIHASGSLIGAIGVSGAPGGEKDEACAAVAIEKITERLEFADDE
ncbi:MAG: heme-binding protein [Gammaproteobacteria bacterium]|nr:heme-binding protein [Gammaproteobacteria bacterium]